MPCYARRSFLGRLMCPFLRELHGVSKPHYGEDDIYGIIYIIPFLIRIWLLLEFPE